MSKCHSCKLRYVCEESAEWACTRNGYRGYMQEDSVEYSSNAVEKVIEAWNRRAGNMAEYIERAEALEITTRTCGDYAAAWSEIRKLPAADVAPVVHGRWDDSGRYTFPSGSTAVRCTNCGCALTVSEYRLNNWNYCPVCGAKMDGGDSDEAD